MTQRRVIRCSLPTAVETFLKARIPDQENIGDAVRELVAASFPKAWVAAKVGSLPHDLLPLHRSMQQLPPWELARLALRELSGCLAHAAGEVREAKLWADISATSLPELQKLARTWSLTEGAIAQPVYLGGIVRSRGEASLTHRRLGSPSYLRIDETEQGDASVGFVPRHMMDEDPQPIQVFAAALLPCPANLLFGEVIRDALQWLGDLNDFRCLTCGSALDKDASLRRRYCPGGACKSAFLRRKRLVEATRKTTR